MEVITIVKLVSLLAVTALKATWVSTTVPPLSNETIVLVSDPVVYTENTTFPGKELTYTLSDNVTEEGDRAPTTLWWIPELASVYPVPLSSTSTDYVPGKTIPMGRYGQAAVRGNRYTNRQGFETVPSGKSVLRKRINITYLEKDCYLYPNGGI